MGWSFRRSIKIAPGVRLNFSKSGVSTSIGVKGLTYNSRGRVTASIPGTGIRYTHTLNSRRTARPVRSAVAAAERIDSSGTAQLSKREQATRDFVQQVQERTTVALQRYFNSHGVFVRAEDLAVAVTLDEHQVFLESLSREFDITTKAIRLGVDIGSISLAEKEKAMLALYEVERKCEQNQGTRGELQDAAILLRNRVQAWPEPPTFIAPFLTALLGCFFLFIKNYLIGSLLLAAAILYGIFRLISFETQKVQMGAEIADANARFDSLVTEEISARPALSNESDEVRFKALAFSVATVVIAIVALAYRPQDRAQAASNPTEQMSQVKDAVLPEVPPGASSSPRLTADFAWMIGRYPADVVKDRRFKAAFNHVPSGEWRKIADRLTVTDAAEIQLKDGYYAGGGCKAHRCASDNAAFVINEATGKGDVIYKETVDSMTGKAVTKGFAWRDLPIGSTPLNEWVRSNDMPVDASSLPASVSSATLFQTSFDCAKARSDAEHLICQDAELAKDDVELSTLFAQAKAKVTDEAAFMARTRKEWSYREQTCHDRECLVRWYADQKTALTQITQTGDVTAN